MTKSTKYPWGNEAMPMSMLPLCILFGAIINGLLLTFTPATGASESFRGPVLVTLLWIHTYYNMIGAQIAIKMDDKVKELSEEIITQINAVKDRSLMNTLEQGLPFLVLLWLMTVFVDSGLATSLGASYVIFRFFYGIAYAYFGHFTILVEIITQPS